MPVRTVMLGCAGAAAIAAVGVQAQMVTPAPAEWPTSYWPAKDWPWPDSMNALKAAPGNYRLLWENEKNRLVEVTIRPGETTPMHATELPAVIAMDQAFPGTALLVETPKDKADPRNDVVSARSAAPPGKSAPVCATLAPQAPHTLTNQGAKAIHYYRIEFKRIDGYGFREHWREWYPWILLPFEDKPNLQPSAALGPPFSKDFPYPIAYDSVQASPKNHFLRYEDQGIRLIDVVGRPGSPENMHGHPYPSVFIYDTTESQAELDAVKAGVASPSVDTKLYPDDIRNGLWGVPAAYGQSKIQLACRTMDPQAPHSNRRNADYPRTFKRLEFKRWEPYAPAQ